MVQLREPWQMRVMPMLGDTRRLLPARTSMKAAARFAFITSSKNAKQTRR